MSNTPDPLSPPAGTTFTPSSRLKVTFLADGNLIHELRRLRNRAGVRPEHTEAWIGGMIGQLLQIATENPDASPREVMAKAHERPVMRQLRHALGSHMSESSDPLSARELAQRAGLAFTPYIQMALTDMATAGVVEGNKIRLAADHGPTPRRWVLTVAGIQMTSTDHPDDQTRFVLGGLLPEVKPIAQPPMIPENVFAAVRIHPGNAPDGTPSGVASSVPEWAASLGLDASKVTVDPDQAPACTCPELSGYEDPQFTGHERGCPLAFKGVHG